MRFAGFFILAFLTAFVFIADAQPFNPDYFNAMRWRMIGPHRGSRTVGAVGVPQQPNVFYIGVNNGGVWKTTDFGRTWVPIFDDQPTGSIGDIAISPSNPNTIYVGSGEGLQRPDLGVGDGMYKSTDAGKTWKNLGLKDAQQIGGLAVDPNNENRIFVAALGHPYGPNKERGVYRSLDGGATWEQVLYKDENTGSIQVTIDPKDPNIVYADLWAGRQGPWENGSWNGPNSGLFKSTDGGNTWKQLTKGLPTTAEGLGRIGFCIAPSDNKRMYATVDAGTLGGIYRSDDAGESWYRLTADERYWGRASDFAEVKCDPRNADIVYSANVVTWKSVDGGKTWDAFRGAPGGDDYHRIWINPNNPEIILIASDQGAIITVNGGQTFSSWYNQPTAQFYHVSADNDFPYNVYSGQQESGSVCIASRGNSGQITYRDWFPIGAEEYGYVAADPMNPEIVYGGKLSKHDKRTGQTQDISPEIIRNTNYRFLRTAPVLFSPVDNKTLYYAGNVLLKTLDGGSSWQTISPDLSRDTWDIPESVGVFTDSSQKKMPRRGVIYTVAPGQKNINTIWCGTDDGLIHLTRDGGKTWKNVTPPAITSWSKVSLMDAGHFDDGTAYATVNRIRCDDMRPHIYKTHDYGVTWTEIVSGLPNDPINVVREDPLRKGLLYAGSERAVYVSFDDGAHWQSLRLNMPATSIRDLVIKDDDIVVGTHGRSFWILDNITSLRQLNSQMLNSQAILYKPQKTYRVRFSMYTDTPVPQEEPAGENPPDGAMIDYWISSDLSKEITLDIKDSTGKLIHHYSSLDTLIPIPPNNVPPYWIRPQQILSGKKGSHRFLWDMRYQPLPDPPSYPIGAIFKNTAPVPTAPFVMPGKYQAVLWANGKTHEQWFEIVMDPRVKTSKRDLQLQHDLPLQCYEGKKQCNKLLDEAKNLIAAISNNPDQELHKQVSLFVSGSAGTHESFAKLSRGYSTLLHNLQETDMPPTLTSVAAARQYAEELKLLSARWEAVKKSVK
jgi:photosystem II stability/assembly factor-like uncharacterized protein